MLSKADSNHHKQNQNLLCYHYTIGQSVRLLAQIANLSIRDLYFQRLAIMLSR